MTGMGGQHHRNIQSARLPVNSQLKYNSESNSQRISY